MSRWARQPLDYGPATNWQYSNTGYVIAGAIVEKVAGKPLFDFLQERIFAPLGMSSARDFDQHALAAGDATGYRGFALAPPREAPVTGAGYGLGVAIEMKGTRRAISHGGEVSGFTAENVVFPDDGVAYVVLVNQDAARATDQIADKPNELLFEDAQATGDARLARARGIFDGLQQGRLDRNLFTANANFYFCDEALADFKSSLSPLGAPEEFKQAHRWLRGGMTGRAYDVKFADRTLRAWTYEMPVGNLEQYQVAIKE